MRQHVNPLSNYYDRIIPIPVLSEIFKNPNLPIHLDLGSASGDFLLKLASENQNWNYIGIEIREKLVINAKLKSDYKNLENLFFAYGNANNLIKHILISFNKIKFQSISVNFPDPWFKKKHHKRRIIQREFINNISKLMPIGSYFIVKSDVLNLYKDIDFAILNSSCFQRIDKQTINLQNYHNPKNILTERENYALFNNLSVYEQVYIRK